MAENLIAEFKRIYLQIKIGYLEETEYNGQFYYYFTYIVPESSLKTFCQTVWRIISMVKFHKTTDFTILRCL